MRVKIVMDLDDIKEALLFKTNEALLGGLENATIAATCFHVKLKDDLDWSRVENLMCELDLDVSETEEE
jgi:hypothetical protein